MPPRTPPVFFSAQIAAARRFYLDMQPPASAALAVVCGGCEHCAADYAIHRADFPYQAIEYVVQGRGRLQLGRKSWELVPGTLFAYGPGMPQRIAADPNAPLVKYFVDFAGRRAPALLREHGPAPGAVCQTSAPSEVMEIFDALVRNGQRETPYTARLSCVLLEHLLLKIGETKVAYGAALTAAFTTYQRCKEYFEQNWAKIHSLDEAARACHVAPAYLCRLFQRYGHQSPYQFLLHRKMQQAAAQLQTTNATIKQVADTLGFSDPFHFSRVFKSVLGVSPSRFAQLGRRATSLPTGEHNQP